MKKQITLALYICLLVYTSSYTQQNSRALYKLILSKNGKAPMYYELLNQPFKSSFTFIHKETPKKVILDELTDEVTLNQTSPDSIQQFIFTDFKKNMIFSKEYLTEDNGNSYREIQVYEPISVRWRFQNEIKKIDNYLCKKAITHFRGRNYTAWYSEDIPIFQGPWKFHGLPGLLFELIDDSGDVSFFLEKIEIPYHEEISEHGHTFTKAITAIDFFKLKDKASRKSNKAFETAILSKLPRGATIELTKDGNNDIEKNFQK